ncbi:MAG: glycosyltransferase family 2 protein [Candidatus Daviesbacteria bacterium]|nr:glycosyltransferase family 2 protein [Candidatus Daviesbacteria bacterium]
MFFKSTVATYSLGTQQASIFITESVVEELKKQWDYLPPYTILVPLFKEGRILPSLILKLMALDYPREKLQILLLGEMSEKLKEEEIKRGEKTTLEVAYELQPQMPSCFEIVACEVPKPGEPQTKPRACNIGLARATGENCVIFDAEDRPEADQLLKVVAGFRQSAGEKVGCIQSRLEFYNSETKLVLTGDLKELKKRIIAFFLTRCFGAEYDKLFNLDLPGMSRLGLPIPLGGTSNHFPTQVLREVGGWDPYNVTEDCDLGIRLAEMGYRTETINSTTLEEANSRLGNWIRQRSRWIKGYMQTYLVYMRNPYRLLRQLGVMNFLSFQLVVGGTPLCLLANPIYWTLTLLYILTSGAGPESELSFVPALIRAINPEPVYYMGLGCLVFGNFIFVHQLLVVCMLKRKYTNALLMILSPLYWALMSVGAWKGFIQLITNPSYWEKTDHGLVEEVSEEQKLLMSGA